MKDLEKVAAKGRNGDTHLAHLQTGEMIIPPVISPEVRDALNRELLAAGIDPAEYTVGDQMSINPETGLPEFGFGKVFKKAVKLLRKVAPIAVNFIPGIGPLAGAALGAGIGALSGGGIKGALAGGLSGYAGAGGASALGKTLGMTSKLGQTALGSGLLGAASGGLQRGAKGALLGGAFGGVGGYANAGGFNDLYEGSALQDVFKGASGALDRVSSGADSLYQGSALQDAFRSGNDALSSIGLGGDTNVASGPLIGGGGSSYTAPSSGSLATDFGNESRNLINNAGRDTLGSTLASNPSTFNTGAEAVANKSQNYFSPIASAALGTYSNDKAEQQLLKAQQANQALLDPYLNFSFNPQDLENDPGYQFNLAEGNKQLDRQQLARGGYFSGNAIREGQQFGQGLADNTYNAAFGRALNTNQQGLAGAGVGMGINTNVGNIKSGSTTNLNNLYTGALGSMFGGDSFSNTGALQGNSQLEDLLRQLGRSSYGY